MAEEKAKKFHFSDNFIETVKNHYYVDKSLFLRDLIDEQVEVSLITRPRRFGKSLNLNMAKTFFERTKEDNSVYFKDLKIWQCGDKYTSQQGKYPVIYFDFKEMRGTSWDNAYGHMKDKIVMEFVRHEGAFKHLPKAYSMKLKRITEWKGSRSDYESSLGFLTELLHKHYKVKPIVLIDEYDAPIQFSYENGYYGEMVSFIRGFLSEGLKGNEHISFAVLTGVNRVSKEGIFSGFNNPVVYSVLDETYSEYFGFTKEEVKAILDDFGHPEKYDEIADWYDGYRFGETEIFNPWSVGSYVRTNFTPATYWSNTSSLGTVKAALENATNEVESELELLASGKRIKAVIDENIPYDKLQNGSNVFSLLLACGYLKNCETTEDERKDFASNEYYLTVPNKEVSLVFCKEILDYMNDKYGKAGDYSANILEALEKSDVRRLQSLLNGFMESSVSVRDKKEDFYHGLFLGLLGNLGENYKMESNREHGDGMPDLTIESFGYGLLPRNRERQSIILEFKYCGDIDDLKSDGMTNEEYTAKKDKLMAASAQTALDQIEKRNYARDFEKLSSRILKYGIAFQGEESKVYLVESVNGTNVKKTSAEGELPL